MAQDLGKLLNVFSREDEERQAAQKAKQLSLPYVNLVGYPIEPKALQILPEELAKKYNIVAYQKTNNQVRVATPLPENPQIMPFMRQMATTTNLDFVPTVCSKTSYIYTLKQYEFIEPEPPTLEKLNVSPEELGVAKGELASLASIAARIRGVSTSKLLEMIFGGAISVGASDVHIEPEENETRVRYRIDGVLQDVVKVPKETYKQAANRIKYLSKMQLDTLGKAQDGRFDISVGGLPAVPSAQLMQAGKPIDVRVSTVPGTWGDVFVMRLLDQSGKKLTLKELGFSEPVRELINEALSKPHGVIFNTGPTGSGKTTTLYAMLQQINQPEIKIITIEDPIEYRIPGIDQTQVKKKAGYDFANALKSVLRQDPDVIMVGEVRDKDTGETAMQAALTGHLVLSTLHTNSAPSAIPRLLDMDIAPFLLSGSINIMMAQRLVRRICPKCHGAAAQSTKIQETSSKQIPSTKFQTINSSQKPPLNLPLGKGEGVGVSERDSSAGLGMTRGVCAICNGTGYKGRIAVAEVLKITPKIEELIEKKASVAEFERMAREEGMVPMYEDGMAKARAGITTEAEVLRVTEEEGVARPQGTVGRK